MDTKAVRKIGLPLVIVAVSVVVLVGLFLLTTERLQALRDTPTDNLTWSLSQVEVDVLKLKVAAQQANAASEPNLSLVRRRFDNAYSRAATIEQGPIFSEVRENPEFAQLLEALQKCFDKLALIIDENDEQMSARLSEVLTLSESILADARELSLSGINITATTSDQNRGSLATLLTVIEFVSGAIILVFVGVIIHILRQSNAAAQISAKEKRANARLKSSFDVSLDAIVVANDRGVILDFNSAAEEVFGFSRQEAVGAPMADLIVPHQHRDAHAAGMKRFRETGQPRLVGQGRIEITALRKSGEEFPVEISIGQAQDERGNIFISYLRDITLRKAAEDALKRGRDEALKAEAAKSNFLAVMSHEMRTPLNGVFGAIELMKTSHLTQEQSKYLDIAQQSGDILLGHVNNVLDVTRIDAGKLELTPKTFDLEAFFNDCLAANEPISITRGNVLELSLGDLGSGFIHADQQRMRQIVYNLLSNALKFTENGSVKLISEIVSAGDTSGVLSIQVTDTGVGIDPHDLDRIFERFYTQEKSYDRLASGAGLGLAICRQILDLMGGQISVTSVPQQGSTFSVTIPVEIVPKQKETQRKSPEVSNIARLNGLEILLVEDNEINRLIVKQMLELSGADVIEAHDGAQAIDIAQSRNFSAVLMDISMPVMNGVEASKKIRASAGPNAQTPIFALTAHALDDEQEVFRAAGMQVGLRKPISRAELVAALSDGVVAPPVATEPDVPLAGGSRLKQTTIDELKDVFDADTLRPMLVTFRSEIQTLLNALGESPARQSKTDLAALVHKSVGSSGLMGTIDLQSILRKLEQTYLSDAQYNIQPILHELELTWAATQVSLAKALLNEPYPKG